MPVFNHNSGGQRNAQNSSLKDVTLLISWTETQRLVKKWCPHKNVNTEQADTDNCVVKATFTVEEHNMTVQAMYKLDYKMTTTSVNKSKSQKLSK